MDNITVNELKQLSDVNIIDIRDALAYNTGHIKGSINIDMNQLLLYPDQYLNRNKVYYIYCQMGVKSYKLCNILKARGYNTININGGYNAYVKA